MAIDNENLEMVELLIVHKVILLLVSNENLEMVELHNNCSQGHSLASKRK